jgi:hypothetical protein
LAVVSKAVPGQDWERQKVTHTSAESGETAGEGEMQLSSSSIWPVVLGAGIALLLFGLATHLGFSVVGLLLIAGSLWGWIGELRYS